MSRKQYNIEAIARHYSREDLESLLHYAKGIKESGAVLMGVVKRYDAYAKVPCIMELERKDGTIGKLVKKLTEDMVDLERAIQLAMYEQ